MSNYLWPYGFQHTRFPCPLSPGVCSNSCPWTSDAIQPSHPLSPPSPLALSLSQIRVFSNELALAIRWPNYWSFSFNISPSNKYLGLISFRIDWFYLLAVQEALKSLFQHHSLKASIFQLSALLMAQLSHPYMTTGKVAEKCWAGWSTSWNQDFQEK